LSFNAILAALLARFESGQKNKGIAKKKRNLQVFIIQIEAFSLILNKGMAKRKEMTVFIIRIDAFSLISESST
jgi:general stress protein CsbA